MNTVFFTQSDCYKLVIQNLNNNKIFSSRVKTMYIWLLLASARCYLQLYDFQALFIVYLIFMMPLHRPTGDLFPGRNRTWWVTVANVWLTYIIHTHGNIHFYTPANQSKKANRKRTTSECKILFLSPIFKGNWKRFKLEV